MVNKINILCSKCNCNYNYFFNISLLFTW